MAQPQQVRGRQIAGGALVHAHRRHRQLLVAAVDQDPTRVLPLSLPGLAVTAFFAFITAWNELMFAFALLSDDRTYTLPVGMQTDVNQFVKNRDYLRASAVLVRIPSRLVFL